MPGMAFSYGGSRIQRGGSPIQGRRGGQRLKTISLEDAIVQARSDLKYIADAVASTTLRSTLGEDSKNFFGQSLSLSSQLQNSVELLNVRSVALGAVKNLASRKSADDAAKFLYHDVLVSWKLGRYLALQNYITTTWALYD
jgi:hypothetical protein